MRARLNQVNCHRVSCKLQCRAWRSVSLFIPLGKRRASWGFLTGRWVWLYRKGSLECESSVVLKEAQIRLLTDREVRLHSAFIRT